MCIHHLGQFKPGLLQNVFHHAIKLQAMLQGAGAVKGNALTRLLFQQGREIFMGEYLADVAGQFADLFCPVGIVGIFRHDIRIILNHHSAAAGGDHNRFYALFDMRPPAIDIVADNLSGFVCRRQVLADCTTAGDFGFLQQFNAKPVEDAGGGDIGLCGYHLLCAAAEYQHAACLCLLWPGGFRLRPGDFFL